MENIARTSCRLCGSTRLKDVLSLGEQYINDFPSSPLEKGRKGKCPLEVVACERCSLLQLRHTAPRELVYSRHCWYQSGINDTIKSDLKTIADKAAATVNLKPDDVFLDIGANDGTLLSYLKGHALRVGCEPAVNLLAELDTNAEYVIGDFWAKEHYDKLDISKAKAITALAVLYETEDPNQFIRDAALVLAPGGVFIAQLMTLKPMLEQNDFGNICHHHLQYYTYKSLRYLFEANGLEIYEVQENAIHGGSYRLFARHLDKGSIDYPEGLGERDFCRLRDRLERERDRCVGYIRRAVKEGKRVYVYGASTKGNVILQYYGLDNQLIQGAAERNPVKWEKYTLTDIPIVREEEARAKADVFLVLPYDLIEEFVKRESDWLKAGGEFVVPLPEFRVIRA